MTQAQEPVTLAQECADYATSLRSTAMVVKLEHGTAPQSFVRAADLFERAASRLGELERWQEEVRNNSDLVNRWEKAEARAAELEAARFAYASEFEPNTEGDPDVGSIHANIRAMKAQLSAIGAGGVEPLRKREQSSEIIGMDSAMALARAGLPVTQGPICTPVAAQPSRECLQQSAVSDLHAGIMNIPGWTAAASFATLAERHAYRAGHRDARHAAAELALQAAPPAPQGEKVYAALPDASGTVEIDLGADQFRHEDGFSEDQMRAFADATAALRAQAAPPAPAAVAVPEGVSVDAWRKGARFALEAVSKVDSICWLTDSMREICITQAAGAVIAERDRLLAATPAQEHATPAQAVIEYRYTGGTHWCPLGPAERMKENFDGVYRLQPGAFPTEAQEHATQLAGKGRDALRCAVGNCTFNGEVSQHSSTCTQRPAARNSPERPTSGGCDACGAPAKFQAVYRGREFCQSCGASSVGTVAENEAFRAAQGGAA